MTEPYHPKPGDIVWTDFDPRTGREQSGRRPAVIVSIQDLYDISRFVIVCPITSKVRPFGSSVVLEQGTSTSGEVLTSQIRCIDTLSRPLVYSGYVSPDQLTKIRAKLADLLGIE